MSLQQIDQQITQLPAGTWRVDAAASHLEFRVKTMWGLATVRGTFTAYAGELRVGQGGVAVGELIVDVASLDTKNAKRDEHLRSPDFFHAERHPELRFLVQETTAEGDDLVIDGELHVGEQVVPMRLPVTVEAAPEGRIRLRTTTSVPRAHVGLSWNKAGMIRGDVFIDGDVELALAG